MKGLEVAFNYYNEYGKPMIENEFRKHADKITVGLVGEGSECYGYDDLTSQDHDFDMGFCLFITQKDYEEFGFKLERAYANLPREYNRFKRKILSPVGGGRRGVIIVEEFYKKFLGTSTIPNDINWWFYVPEYSLSTATNGKIFDGTDGYFIKVRNALLKGYPKDVKLKKLAKSLILAGQSGQYNYSRCISHGERGSASLAICEFVKHFMSAIYLLNNTYQPFYKWAFKGLRDLPILSECETSLEGLLEYGNDKKESKLKCEIIEDLSLMLINQLKKQNLTDATCLNLETHAYSITDKIQNAEIRNMHIMEG